MNLISWISYFWQKYCISSILGDQVSAPFGWFANAFSLSNKVSIYSKAKIWFPLNVHSAGLLHWFSNTVFINTPWCSTSSKHFPRLTILGATTNLIWLSNAPFLSSPTKTCWVILGPWGHTISSCEIIRPSWQKFTIVTTALHKVFRAEIIWGNKAPVDILSRKRRRERFPPILTRLPWSSCAGCRWEGGR